jgi:hypothetical protein
MRATRLLSFTAAYSLIRKNCCARANKIAHHFDNESSQEHRGLKEGLKDTSVELRKYMVVERARIDSSL